MRQAYRPVFETAITYEPVTGEIEVVASDRDMRLEIVKAAVTHLLGIEFKENRLPLRRYDLSVLLTPYDFPVDGEDGIEGVEVREVWLMPIDDSSRRVALENMARADGTIWSMADGIFDDRTPPARRVRHYADQARGEAGQASGEVTGGARSRSRSPGRTGLRPGGPHRNRADDRREIPAPLEDPD